MILLFFKISVLVVFSSVAEVEKFALGDSRMAILVVATCSSALALVWI